MHYAAIIDLVRYNNGSRAWCTAHWSWRRPLWVEVCIWYKADTLSVLDVTCGETDDVFVFRYLWRRWRS